MKEKTNNEVLCRAAVLPHCRVGICKRTSYTANTYLTLLLLKQKFDFIEAQEIVGYSSVNNLTKWFLWGNDFLVVFLSNYQKNHLSKYLIIKKETFLNMNDYILILE